MSKLNSRIGIDLPRAPSGNKGKKTQKGPPLPPPSFTASRHSKAGNLDSIFSVFVVIFSAGGTHRKSILMTTTAWGWDAQRGLTGVEGQAPRSLFKPPEPGIRGTSSQWMSPEAVLSPFIHSSLLLSLSLAL